MRTGTIHIYVPEFVIIFSPFSLFVGYQHVCLPIMTSTSTDEPSQYHAITGHSGIAAFNFLTCMAG
jgi:hypothetical protein